jgi:large subunit ribosomal protein L15
MPLYRRLPKRGHTCRNTKEIVAINVQLLNVFEDGATVDVAALKQKGLVSNPRDGVKILGNGEIKKKLTVKVNYFSAGAVEKIKAAGGKTEVVGVKAGVK